MHAASFNPRGLYVHIPFCDGKCAYCAFYSTPYQPVLADRYLAALAREFARYPTLTPETVYVGGGTPSMLSAQQLRRLCRLIISHSRPLPAYAADHGQNCSGDLVGRLFKPGVSDTLTATAAAHPLPDKSSRTAIIPPAATPDYCRGRSIEQQSCQGPNLIEWTVEVNPGSLTADKLNALVQAGVNRISLGAQSFDDTVLRRLERRHTAADIFKSITLIRSAGIRNLGLDLMACVPGFSGRVWQDTLRQAIASAPEHISVYALTNEEGSRLNRWVHQGTWKPFSDAAQLKALDTAEAHLARAGYGRYEISNYAKPGFECRHNLACWRGEEYLGLGPAAASHVGLQRWTNQADLSAYLSALEQNTAPPGERELLSPAQKIEEQVIFGLRMAEGVSAELALGYQAGLQNLSRQGLVKKADGQWRLTRRGRHLADYIAVELMRACPTPELVRPNK